MYFITLLVTWHNNKSNIYFKDKNEVDLTGVNQHGFKRRKSTKTAVMSIQSALGTALEEEKFAMMASLDQNLAFDLVNVKL